MVLFCVTGELGTGKTLSATFLGWKNWFFRGRKIYSNYHLFKIPYIYVNSINKLNEMKEGFVLADELWTICVSPDSMVLCNDNNKEIKDINYLDTVYSCDTNNFKLVKNKVSDIQIIKNDTGYLVETKNYKLKCTKEHPFFVYSNGKIIQKRAEELNTNDWVLVIKNLDEPKKQLIDEETAQLLGYITSDGHIYYRKDKDYRNNIYCIQIDEGNLNVAKKYQKLIKEKLNLNCTINHIINRKYGGKKGHYRLRIYGKKYIEELIKLIGDSVVKNKWGYKFVDIPKVIRNSNNKVLGAFLRGVFDGDGTINITEYKSSRGNCFDCRIRLGLSHKNYWKIKKIKWLLLRFNIYSYILKTKANVILVISDRQSIINYYNNIGFYSDYKQKVLEKAVNYIKSRKRSINFSRKLPLGEILKKGIEKLCRYENITFSQLEHDIYDKQKIGYLRKSFSLNITEGVLSKIINYLKGYESFNKCEELVFIDKLLNSNFTLQKVKKKEIIKLPIAYDITVPNTSNFIAEGFVVHNCDSRLSGSKKTRFASSILLRSRKRILEYVFTAQIVDLLDKRVRKVLDFIAYPILNVNETICKLLIFRGNKVKPQTYLKTIYFKTQGVYELYDTNEEIDMDDEDKKGDIIAFQENYNPKHGYFCECDECNTKFFNTWKEANDYAEKWWMKHKNYVYSIL